MRSELVYQSTGWLSVWLWCSFLTMHLPLFLVSCFAKSYMLSHITCPKWSWVSGQHCYISPSLYEVKNETYQISHSFHVLPIAGLKGIFLEDSQVSAQLNLKIFELSGSHINHYEIKMAGSSNLWENHILVHVKFPQEMCSELYGEKVT